MTPRRPPQKSDETVIKEALQGALKDWLDSKFIQFGKWSLAGVAAMTFAMVVWFFFFSHGWRLPQ